MNIHHRYFVQYMLKYGISTVNNAADYCKHISRGKIENMTHLKTLVIEINREISKQFYRIVFSVCEVTNQNLVLWLNTKNDDIAKFQTSYSAIELEYFHTILQEIIHSEDHRLTVIISINITSTLTSYMSRDSGQKVLNRWLTGGYFVKRGDYIHLGARTILEFTSYLRSNCPDSICNLCSEIVFTGTRCSHCNKVLHSHCMQTYLSNQSVCPCCRNEWTTENHNGTIDAVDATNCNGAMSTDDDELDSVSQSQTHSSGSNRRHRLYEESDISDIDEPGPSTRKRHR